MSLPERLDSAQDILKVSGFLGTLIALFVRGRSALFGLLGAPFERTLAQRESHALRQDNAWLEADNANLRRQKEAMRREIIRLGGDPGGISPDGFSSIEDGTRIKP